MDERNQVLIGIFLGILGILLFTSICAFGYYKNKELKIANFQNTISDLSDEQKCLHICGFEWQGTNYFDNYKYCVEKCDRISERTMNNINNNIG